MRVVTPRISFLHCPGPRRAEPHHQCSARKSESAGEGDGEAEADAEGEGEGKAEGDAEANAEAHNHEAPSLQQIRKSERLAFTRSR